MTATLPPNRQATGIRQALLAGVFVAVLATVFVFRQFMVGGPTETNKLSPEESLKRHGFYLEEVSKNAKIDFKHELPTKIDSRLAHIMPIIVSMGASVSVVDFNRDGLQDLYVVTSKEGGKNRLYQNNGDGTFTDVAEAMGVADLNQPGDGVCMGAVWGDYDNDGFDDLLVYRWGKPELYHNEKGKGFKRVTAEAKLPSWVNANSAIWVDFDRDGKLDLFIAGYWADDVDLWNLKSTRIMPESFQYANNGGKKYLLRNKGDGSFEDVTAAMGITSTRWTLAVAAADLRGTGYPDLFLANDYGVNEFFANQEGKKFVEMGKSTRIGDKSKSGMSVSFGDVFNQGRFGIYVTNISEPGNILQGNNLWIPERNRTGDGLRYTNQAGGLGVEMGGWSWGAQFGDLNNDGRVDLIMTNGYISADRNSTYWYDYSRIAGALTEIIIDAQNWPNMKGRSLAGYQQHCLWINRNGKFDEVAPAVGFSDTHDGRAVALVDLWNRGVLDVVEANQNGPLLVYKNTVAKDRDWVQFELEGTKSNKSAIGAQVKLYWNDQVQVQEVSGGNGYASQNQRRVHFGLGQNVKIDRAEIYWPSGHKQTIPASKIQLHTLNKVIEEKS